MDAIAKHVYMARIAEQVERYQEMVDHIKYVASHPKEGQDHVILTKDERSLLSVAYKNIVSGRRASWRSVKSSEQKESAHRDSTVLPMIVALREKIEKELTDICMEIITLLRDYLIFNGKENVEDQVFYLKMVGDYYRYLAEFQTGEALAESKANADQAYQEAMKRGQEANLSPTIPVLLGLALNYSVFYYEILNNPDKVGGIRDDGW
ncbi:hypothetical protein WA538_000679 [Blastocystis sp. DL]